MVVFDDIQWAEPTFLDLRDDVAHFIEEHADPTVCRHAPSCSNSGRHGWRATRTAGWSRSVPLPSAESDGLITNLVGVRSDSVRTRIAEVAEGNPLFVEETLRGLWMMDCSSRSAARGR